ncbi:MAG: hypothetical protein Q4P78_06335 [Rothia sp. (in: high G+C Gram-positive bacteria)]|uniref:hypothetical protein n=1 Tax=Rothia sp. (in: high G+C Gram-positive bacteria) TaxID=1885016 RepID=UPI0026E0CE13|nr:hypothetical protein [Rothia sp. (in: high G+C Gram-positive bacteria)]MDO5750807.1 hypothetical protein [Rothia sp. (in: high G+C Gram-positive bacteria)]
MKHKFLAMLGVLLVASGCSSQPTLDLPRDKSVHAALDYKNNKIIMPISSYADYDNEVYYNRAITILYARCYASKGESYSAVERKNLQGTGKEYGVWNPEHTVKYGFFEKVEQAEALENNNRIVGKYERQCYEETVKNQILEIGNFPSRGETYRKIAQDSHIAATQLPEWKAAREKWFTCLRERGLTPRTEDSAWTSTEGYNIVTSPKIAQGITTEEETRVATIEAQCSKDTGMAQTLADLEASYQAPLIKKHEVQLQKELDEYKANNEKFKKFVLDNQ